MSRRRSTIKGAASFRRLIRALPDSARKQLLGFLQGAGPVLAAEMKAKLPVLAKPRPNRTPGAARASIKWRVTPSTLNLKVGQLSKRSDAFYAHILDVGRRAQTVRVTRGRRWPYDLHVSPLKPLNIVRTVRATFRTDDLPGYRTLMDSILSDAARGAGRD